MKILIVEDDSEKNLMLKNYMEESFAADVNCVMDEKAAKNALKDKKAYDVVLLDMSLPDMVNVGDLEAFGGMNVLSDMVYNNILIPVIVVTSYWDFKQLLRREAKELFAARNKLFREEIDYDKIEIVEDFDYLDRMHQYMSYTYNSVYFGSIEFNYRNENWKKVLKEFMEDMHNEYFSL